MSGVRTLILVLCTGIFSLLLISCAKDKATVQEPVDGPSTRDIKASDVVDAVPRNEPLARYGNHSPYEVFGKTYHVMASSKGYHERGVASWYGSKFHGRRTSSGEPYDMHLATAAHKSLPLPTYAEVNYLDYGRKVVVKINDRGPFKHDRLIDMSYGAALRLGMTETGTARVDVRVIDVSDQKPAVTTTAYPAPATTNNEETWLQAGAFGKRNGAEQLTLQLRRAGVSPVSIRGAGGLFRVWLGPYNGQSEVESVIRQVIELGFERPHRVKR